MRYSDEVLKRVREPQRVGTLPDGEGDVGAGEIGTLESGTVTRLQVRICGDRVVAARFRVFGCSAAIASASLVAEWLEGASIEDAQRMTPEQIVERLELAPEREHVARMTVDAAQQALEAAQRQKSSRLEDEGSERDA